MVPFKVFDRDKKEVWIVINYQTSDGGYLAAREADDDQDGSMKIFTADELSKLRMVELMVGEDSYGE